MHLLQNSVCLLIQTVRVFRPLIFAISKPRPTVTFVKLSIDQVYIVWQVDKAAMEIAFPDGVKCTSNDVPGKLHRKTSSLRLPRVYTKLLLASRNHPCLWYEVATTEADVNLDIYSSPDGWHSHAMAQEAFVSAQDVLTGRVDFLYRSESDSDKRQKSSGMLYFSYLCSS